MFVIQEHRRLLDEAKKGENFDKEALRNNYKSQKLLEWNESEANYFASFFIGAEWIKDNEEAVAVTPKMENIDFQKMFLACFASNIKSKSFDDIYEIDLKSREIEAPKLKSVLSLLLIVHFVAVVSRIKKLKKNYISRSENLKKIKGSIRILKNERKNIMQKRYDHFYCNHNEFSEDIPENRLIKKALIFSKNFISRGKISKELNVEINRALAMFQNISDEIVPSTVRQIKEHKLFSQYTVAVRLAKMILQYFDYSITKTAEENDKVRPFWIDMALLYEHYVHKLLVDAYDDKKINYQFNANYGNPDFLYISDDYKAILDAKYKTEYTDSYVIEDIRQLSGYSRDKMVLRKLGYDITANPLPPCIIIYPTENVDNGVENPFLNTQLSVVNKEEIGSFIQFYKVAVPLPRKRN